MELKWAVTAIIGILLAALCIWLAAIFIKWLSSLDWTFESASERAGRNGEEIAAEIISRVLGEGDHLLTNIEIAYDGRRAEMDCIVVNRFGAFISSLSDIDRAIHTEGKNHLHPKEIGQIITLLQRDAGQP